MSTRAAVDPVPSYRNTVALSEAALYLYLSRPLIPYQYIVS
jgi:hypothetical protein